MINGIILFCGFFIKDKGEKLFKLLFSLFVSKVVLKFLKFICSVLFFIIEMYIFRGGIVLEYICYLLVL